MLHDGFSHTLWQLDHAADGKNARLSQVEVREGERSLGIEAAIPWQNDTLLLATDAGFKLYQSTARKLSNVEWKGPEQAVHALARDGLGRLWLGGDEGLWVVDAVSKTLESFDRVPWIRRNDVNSLTLDPRHPDGVIAALGERGVVFVRALQRP